MCWDHRVGTGAITLISVGVAGLFKTPGAGVAALGALH